MRSRLLLFGFVCKLLITGALFASQEESHLEEDLWNSGPFYDQFKLTLQPGTRTEAVGPFFFHEESEEVESWGLSPIYSQVRNAGVEGFSFDLVYPIFTYDRYGTEYRFQIFQLFSFSGGNSMQGSSKRKTTLFPIYFRQRSNNPDENYFALAPFYGHIKQRLLRDDIRFVAFPLYIQSRKKDVVTDNYVYPFFHRRQGNSLSGWQFWPVFGWERKGISEQTNSWGELERSAGHRKMFALWPFFHDGWTGLGSTNEIHQQLFFPLYSRVRSTSRDTTTFPWPIGYTHTRDRENRFEEWGAPWPFIVFARGEGKTMNRVWPFFSEGKSKTLESRFYLWPIFKENRIHSRPLDRRRSRVLFFLYQDWRELNMDTDTVYRRQDLWPLFTHRQERDGRELLRVGALLEPWLPTNQHIERNYSPLWTVWRAEKNPKTGEKSQSLLWNLYRYEKAPQAKKISLFCGLFQYHNDTRGRRWRLFFIPFGKRTTQ